MEFYPNRNERRDALDQDLVRFVSSCGYLSMPIPNILLSVNQLYDWLKVIQPSAIILSGGDDIGCFPERDSTENYLLDYACQNGLPLLGICRGAQLMGIWSGAKLKTIDGHVNSRHHINGIIRREVNSFHNQTLTTIPTGFKILAYSEDGEIEAFGHTRLPWEGWMWHPEREKNFDKRDIERVRVLME